MRLLFKKITNSLLYTILGSQYQCEVCIPTMSTPSMTICSLEQGIVKANIELWHQQARHDNVINIRSFFASSFKYQIKRGLFLCYKQNTFLENYRPPNFLENKSSQLSQISSHRRKLTHKRCWAILGLCLFCCSIFLSIYGLEKYLEF